MTEAVEPTAGKGPRHRNIALVVILAMTFMEVLDGTIVNVALPVMQRDLGVDMAGIQWVLSIYLVVTCSALLIFGRLGDMFGKVRMFQVGVALFTAGSALCAMSGGLVALVLARAVQALGGAASLANNQGIITELFPEGRGRALGLVATFTALGAMCGPTVGGLVVSVLPWEFIFIINLPIGIVSFLVGLKVLSNQAPAERRRFDFKGAALLVPCTLLFFLAVTSMETGVTAGNAAMLAASLILLVLFVLVERRVPEPLMMLSVFKDVRFCIDLLSMVVVFGAISGLMVLMPYYLENARGIAAGAAGLIIACYPLVNSICGPISGALSDKIGCERPTMVAQFIFAAGLVVLGGMTIDTPLFVLVPCIMFTSFGSSVFQAPNNSLIMGHAPEGALGFVGSLGNFMRYLGQSLGLTVSTGVLYSTMSTVAGYPVASYVPGHPEIFMAGMRAAFHVIALIVLVSALLCVFREYLSYKERKAAREARTASGTGR